MMGIVALSSIVPINGKYLYQTGYYEVPVSLTYILEGSCNGTMVSKFVKLNKFPGRSFYFHHECVISNEVPL